jgi:ParB family chromosome partitioning protein
MSEKKRGLGMGIAALLGDQVDHQNISQKSYIVSEINLEEIETNPNQPRKKFDESKLKELSTSIIQNGLLQPITLTKINNQSDKYTIVAGERRYRASRMANLKTIKAIIVNLDEKEILKNAIIENVQRENLNIVEEALAYRQMLDIFNYTHEKISEEIGKSRSHVTNAIRILSLPENIILAVKNNTITFGHAKVLLSTDNPEIYLTKIIENELSVRQLEDLTSQELKPKTEQNEATENTDDNSNITYEMIKQIYNPLLKQHSQQQNDSKVGSKDANEAEIEDFKSITSIEEDANRKIDLEVQNNINTIEYYIQQHTGLQFKLIIDQEKGGGEIVIKYKDSDQLFEIINKFFLTS